MIKCSSTERGDYVLNMSEILRGYTDTIILAQLSEHDSYGYEINKNIVEATDSALELKEATLYTTFRRLEISGHIASYWGDENTGARRRYYSITESGSKLLAENISDYQKANNIIFKLIKGKQN